MPHIEDEEFAIRVVENNTDAIPLVLTKEFSNGEVQPYNELGSATGVELFCKRRRGEPDANAFIAYSLADHIAVTSGAEGKLSVEFQAADLLAPGHYFYHLDVLFGAKRKTVSSGPFIIRNI